MTQSLLPVSKSCALTPWFKFNNGNELVTPEWRFRWDQRKLWP